MANKKEIVKKKETKPSSNENIYKLYKIENKKTNEKDWTTADLSH